MKFNNEYIVLQYKYYPKGKNEKGDRVSKTDDKIIGYQTQNNGRKLVLFYKNGKSKTVNSDKKIYLIERTI